MKQKLKQWVTHNLLLKIIALILAILTWLVFYSSEDPIVQESFNVPVEIEHLDEFKSQGHYIAIDGNEDLDNLEVRVYLSARSSVIEKLRARDVESFLRAYVDVYELQDSSVERLMLHYEFTDVLVENKCKFYDLKNTSYLEVKLDESATKEIEVRYEITGSPEEGYLYIKDDENIQISPEFITLTGPSNQLSEIAYGKVVIRVEGATANVNKKGDIVLYDANDNVITYSRDVIRVPISEASVFVPIYMTKTVALQTYLEGSVPEGYEYGKDVALSVAKIDIYGPESALNKISSIPLPTVDMSSLTSNYKQTYNLHDVLKGLYSHGEVKLTEDSEEEVTMTFTVGRQETKTLQADTSSITIYGKKNGWNVAFTSDKLPIELVGLKDNLREFDLSGLKMSIRLKDEDYTAGKHVIEVSVSGLGNVSLKNEKLTVEVEITAAS